MKLLSPLGWLYGLGATARNALYDRGLFRVHDLGTKTISIGNITAGGTGKTPLVAAVANILVANGETVCVLTRGYGRKDPSERILVSDGENVLADAVTGGDEPVELARTLSGKAAIVADRDRVAAAAWTREKFGITAFVLDDGFQHRRAGRDLDIVCIDATDPFGGGEVLPAGTLREPVQNLTRAGAIVITRANLAKSTDDLTAQIRKLNTSAPIFTATSKVCGVSKLVDFLNRTHTLEPVEDLQPIANGFLFCGLGNPESFRRQLVSENFQFAGVRTFPDHHAYTQSDMQSVQAEAKNIGATSLITTGKDAVKLTGIEFTMPCFVVTSAVEIVDGKAFAQLVTSI
ncbi:MAG: tetraacyldisaccharide 4'-kinase [Acidobacteriota bacterium]